MNVKSLLLTMGVALSLTGCDMMTEDPDDTYCGLFVAFKYDYNLQRADMFADHVGEVTLYVFDSDGRYVRDYQTADIDAMGRVLLDGTYAHAMRIDDLPKGDYSFVALAAQRPYDETLRTPGAKYRRDVPTKGQQADGLTVTLDRQQQAPAARAGQTVYVNNVAPLDTLWHAMSAGNIHVEPTGYSVTTLSLTRDTKMLTIGLHNLDDDKRTSIKADDFDMFILDSNGRLAYDNSLLADDNLVYTPYSTWNTQSLDDTGTVVDVTAHATLMFNRLVWSSNPDQNALLVIRNRQTQQEVAAINLTDFLAQGRNAYDQWAYSPQEYLDRAYDFYLDFFIKNDTWLYALVRINALSWAKRIQNVSLQ